MRVRKNTVARVRRYSQGIPSHLIAIGKLIITPLDRLFNKGNENHDAAEDDRAARYGQHDCIDAFRGKGHCASNPMRFA